MSEPPSILRDIVTGPDSAPVLEVLRPAVQVAPIVVASPHSGRWYPPDFVASSRLDPLSLRRSEDAFVDRLFQDAPTLGIPLLSAQFPRAYIDVNREPWELDPEMFRDAPLPSFVNVTSPRVAAGLGTLARIVAPRREIYRHKLSFREAEFRVTSFYRPYHEALSALVQETRARFGFCLLIDAHSMPALVHDGTGAPAPDVILGDVYGASCDRHFAEAIAAWWRDQGRVIGRNVPYAGGYITRRYGRPPEGLHAVQLELSRALYLDEANLTPTSRMPRLRDQIRGLLTHMVAVTAPRRLVAE